MKKYRLYEKETNLYVGTLEIHPDEINEIEKDFILRPVDRSVFLFLSRVQPATAMLHRGYTYQSAASLSRTGPKRARLLNF